MSQYSTHPLLAGGFKLKKKKKTLLQTELRIKESVGVVRSYSQPAGING